MNLITSDTALQWSNAIMKVVDKTSLPALLFLAGMAVAAFWPVVIR